VTKLCILIVKEEEEITYRGHGGLSVFRELFIKFASILLVTTCHETNVVAQEVAGLKRLADSKIVVIDEKEATSFFSFDLLIPPLQSIISRL